MWGWYDGRQAARRSATPAPTWSRSAPPRDAVRAFADRARRAGRRCSSIVGPADATAQLWRLLEPHWGPAREVRAHQPLMVTDRLPADVAPDPLRPPHPQGRDGRRSCRRAWRCSPRRSASRRWPATAACSTRPGSPNSSAPAAPSPASTDGKVVFKAEIGAATAAGLPDPGRLGGPRVPRPGLSRRPAWPPCCATPSPTSPRWSACTSTTSTPRPARRTAGSGFQEVGAFMSVLF